MAEDSRVKLTLRGLAPAALLLTAAILTAVLYHPAAVPALVAEVSTRIPGASCPCGRKKASIKPHKVRERTQS